MGPAWHWSINWPFLAVLPGLFSLAGSETVDQRRHVYIGIGATPHDANWIHRQRRNEGIAYVPVFVQAHPRWAAELQSIAEEMEGVFYPNAAWTADGDRMMLNMATHPLYKTGLDSIFHVPGRHDASMEVTTVDLARLLQEHTAPSDVVVMRMDVEGSEYTLLRHLLNKGLACRLSKLYVEVHAMSQPTLHDFRTFDVLLPWLLEPCGTQVFVDSNYFSIAESYNSWPQDDGGCLQCPLLHVPLPGTLRDKCPAAAVSACFDEEFTCERCCSRRKGPRGDSDCWSRRMRLDKGVRMGTGGYGFPVPADVLQRIKSGGDGSAERAAQVEALAGEEAGRPSIFSYEMCCAGMTAVLSPTLRHFVVEELHENEEFNNRPLSKAELAADASQMVSPIVGCEDVSGLYEDSGGGTVRVTQAGCSIEAENQLQRWSVSGSVAGQELTLWDMPGTLRRSAASGSVTWPNGAAWVQAARQSPS